MSLFKMHKNNLCILDINSLSNFPLLNREGPKHSAIAGLVSLTTPSNTGDISRLSTKFHRHQLSQTS